MLLHLLTLAIAPLISFLIGRGIGMSAFRGERVAGIVAGAALPFLFWLVVLGFEWLAPEVQDGAVQYTLVAGGMGVILLTPICFAAAWFGNRRSVRLRARFTRSERLG